MWYSMRAATKDLCSPGILVYSFGSFGNRRSELSDVFTQLRWQHEPQLQHPGLVRWLSQMTGGEAHRANTFILPGAILLG